MQNPALRVTEYLSDSHRPGQAHGQSAEGVVDTESRSCNKPRSEQVLLLCARHAAELAVTADRRCLVVCWVSDAKSYRY